MGNVIKVNPFEYSIRNYESTDTGLVTEFELDSQFTDSSYVELYVYDMNENLIRLDLNHLKTNVLTLVKIFIVSNYKF